MLHILLLILKIIGITLGILIGIVLLLLCLALFVPVRYRIEVERSEKEGDPPIKVMAKITWLLHIVNARLQYSSDLKLRLRIFFITILRIPEKIKKSGKKPKKEPKTKSKKKSEEKSKEKDLNKAESKNNSNSDTEFSAKDTKEKGENSAKDDKSEIDKNAENTDYYGQKEQDYEDSEQKLSIKEKLIKIYDFFINIRYTIKKICDRIKGIFENIEYYVDIIEGDMFKSSFALCKGELFSIFSYIRPRKVKADLIIGTGDPAATAQIISYYYAIMYPLVGSDVRVIGDFENKRIEGTAFIKGKVKLFTFLKAVLRIYFNKDIKELLKLFKKEDE